MESKTRTRTEQPAAPIPFGHEGRKASDITRDNILNAYWHLYQAGQGVSVKELMAAAGYQRSTFYLHFNSIRAVLDELEERLICREQVTALQMRFLTTDMPASSLLRALSPLLDGTLPYWRALLSREGDPRFRDTLEALWLPVLRARLARQQPSSPTACEAQADFLFHGALGAFVRLCERGPEQAAETILLQLLQAIRFKMDYS